MIGRGEPLRFRHRWRCMIVWQEMGAMVTRDAVLFPVRGAKPPKKVHEQV